MSLFHMLLHSCPASTGTFAFILSRQFLYQFRSQSKGVFYFRAIIHWKHGHTFCFPICSDTSTSNWRSRVAQHKGMRGTLIRPVSFDLRPAKQAQSVGGHTKINQSRCTSLPWNTVQCERVLHIRFQNCLIKLFPQSFRAPLKIHAPSKSLNYFQLLSIWSNPELLEMP